MTTIRLHDIRESDVHPDAGMSNIPWEYEYGFQKESDLQDNQGDILDELYFYQSTGDEAVLDGLSPDAPTYRGNEVVQVGTFTTRTTVERAGKEICVTVSREILILKANEILRAAATDVSIAIQREYIHRSENHIETVYEFCPGSPSVRGIVIGDDVFPLSQLLDLRSFPVVGKYEWVEVDDEC